MKPNAYTKIHVIWGMLFGCLVLASFLTLGKVYFAFALLKYIGVGIGVGCGALMIIGGLDVHDIEFHSGTDACDKITYWFKAEVAYVFTIIYIPLWFPIMIILCCWIFSILKLRKRTTTPEQRSIND